ncbi:hypothetical protein SSTU70S_07087 [Stutzerimonas stutzeri]
MADHELHAVVDDLVGDRHGLLRIAGVVVAYALELLAVHPAGLVDLLDGHLGPDELHVPVLRDRSGHRAGHSDPDGIGRKRVTGGAAQDEGENEFGQTLVLFICAPLASLLFGFCMSQRRYGPIVPERCGNCTGTV